jgi:anti-anti-sigma regulatory factor
MEAESRDALATPQLFMVLDASAVHSVDLTGLRALEDIARDLQGHGIRFLLARARGDMRDVLKSYGGIYAR